MLFRIEASFIYLDLIHVESNEAMTSYVFIDEATQRKPQAFKSATTYLKRTLLLTCLGIADTDDDGESMRKEQEKMTLEARDTLRRLMKEKGLEPTHEQKTFILSATASQLEDKIKTIKEKYKDEHDKDKNSIRTEEKLNSNKA